MSIEELLNSTIKNLKQPHNNCKTVIFPLGNGGIVATEMLGKYSIRTTVLYGLSTEGNFYEMLLKSIDDTKNNEPVVEYSYLKTRIIYIKPDTKTPKIL